MNNFVKRTLSLAGAGVMALSALTVGMTASATSTTSNGGTWLKGDFHTHTFLSDGSYTAAKVAEKAVEYGLDWYSACDHGGGTVSTLKPDGTPWADGDTAGGGTAISRAAGMDRGKNVTHVMPRWASILSVGEQMIEANRKNSALKGLLQFSGFEWNVPKHEHASVGIVGNSDFVKKELAYFNFMFDSATERGTTEAFKALESHLNIVTLPITWNDGEVDETDSNKLVNKTTNIKFIVGRSSVQRYEAYYDPNGGTGGSWKLSADAETTFDGVAFQAPATTLNADSSPNTNANRNLKNILSLNSSTN